MSRALRDDHGHNSFSNETKVKDTYMLVRPLSRSGSKYGIVDAMVAVLQQKEWKDIGRKVIETETRREAYVMEAFDARDAKYTSLQTGCSCKQAVPPSTSIEQQNGNEMLCF
jgi:hypothetical protein